jgi:hypothetical protein
MANSRTTTLSTARPMTATRRELVRYRVAMRTVFMRARVGNTLGKRLLVAPSYCAITS